MTEWEKIIQKDMRQQMTVKDLIKALKKMPHEADVYFLWDGALRSGADDVWLTRTGLVGIGQAGAVVYGTEDRPHDAPTSSQVEYWHVLDEVAKAGNSDSIPRFPKGEQQSPPPGKTQR